MDNPVPSYSYRGLSEDNVQEALATYGYNEIPAEKAQGLIHIALGVIKEPMFLLLVSAATLYLCLGNWAEGFILLCFVFVIMGIEFHQERKTRHALEALRDMAAPRSMVIRDSSVRQIHSRELVPGDIMLVKEGDRVTADARILEGFNLLVDESLLTGECTPVRKRPWTGDEHPFSPGGEDLPVIYSGTLIVRGNGIAEVAATGLTTEIGRIGKVLSEIAEEPTRLNKDMGRLITRMAWIGAGLCIVLTLAYNLIRGGMIKGVLAGITLAMSILPEEFPVILSVFMAIGSYRMTRQHVLIRKPSALETLGAATVLCSDKTGTLTHNTMCVQALFDGRHVHERETGDGVWPDCFYSVANVGVMASHTDPFDPMEKAIADLEQSMRPNGENSAGEYSVVREYPLTPDCLAMSRVYLNHRTKDHFIAAKGAPEAICDLCHLAAEARSDILCKAESFAQKGLRVLGVAQSGYDSGRLPDSQHDFDFFFVGLIGLKDPIRSEVPQSVGECYNAGIRVIMITGDYPVTAQQIGHDIGLMNSGKVVSGDDLTAMSRKELETCVKDVNIFARVIPTQKLALVDALKHNNEIVAMTGDGVNDSPALKSAHIGIAMGLKGTDVAREASHAVILDDDFSSIVRGIKMGRRIYDNLRKAMAYTFAIHVPITGLALIPVFFKNLPLMLWPVHVVFLEMIIDPACSIIFEAEYEEKDVMNRPPRPMDEPFFGLNRIFVACIQGLWILAATFLVYGVSVYLGHTEGQTRSLTFTALVAANIFTILSNRSFSRSIIHTFFVPNPTVKWVICFAVSGMLLIHYIPFFRNLFLFDFVPWHHTLAACLTGCLSIVWFEVYKYWKNHPK